ncbi:MAG TPA: prepilin-type N-terminal cleavage/methylation domain-containing protein [Candidatus Sulfotelmatobacter sp.]|nr:prepilin-type N-terminal cleavage/methylation domain-containing protein [Candidatus Sulfotelmatobacter sp.]
MNTNSSRQRWARLQSGFTLLELMVVCAILAIVLGAVFQGINTITQRSQAEQVKVDMTQAGREFVDEFERDMHQVGYPNCRMVATIISGVPTNCPADSTNTTTTTVAENPTIAVGLVHVDNTKIVFEGDMDGDGTVENVEYKLVDANGTNPPASCPCVLQRSQISKPSSPVALPWSNLPRTFYQELQNVVNSGQPTYPAFYGGGAPISGNTSWGVSNTTYYAALSTFKDYPVFQAYDQFGSLVQLPRDLGTAGGADTPILTCSISSVRCIKSIRLTINLLANATTGVDLQTKVRPVTTLVGSARLVNNF